MNEHSHQEESFGPAPYTNIPGIIEGGAEKTEHWQIVKDERDANGNGYVEVFIEAAPVRTSGVTHQYKVGYQVTDKLGGTPGKKWEKVHEEDFGAAPKTDTIQ